MHKFRVIVLGSVSCGKTAIIDRFIMREYHSDQICTIGTDVRHMEYNVVINGKDTDVHLVVYDTSGNKQFWAITHSYYAHVDAVILVFDLSNLQSLHELYEIMQNLEKYAHPTRKMIRFLIGAKMETLKPMGTLDAIDPEEIKKAINQLDIVGYFEVSAKANENITKTFNDIAAQLILKEREKEIKKEEMSIANPPAPRETLQFCCTLL